MVRTSVLLVSVSLCASDRVSSSEELRSALVNAPPLLSIMTTERLLETHVVSHDELKTTVDRRAFLRELVERVVASATSDQGRVELWTRWLPDHMAHPPRPPLDTQGQAVYDPLWLLRTRVGHCGQTNRLLIDGLDAIGYKVRLVQFTGHVGAEVHFDGGWRYIDADILDNGAFIRKRDGTLASGKEITEDLSLLDGVTPFEEIRRYTPPGDLGPAVDEPTSKAWLRRQFSERVVYDGFTTPFVWVKTATREQENNVYFGWNYYRAEPGW
jgi:hypothetical protein